MRVRTLLLAVAPILLLCLASPTAALPDKGETKKARKKLKRNAKRLLKIQKFIAKQDMIVRTSANAAHRDRAEKAIESMCTKANKLLEPIRAADNAMAAQVLLQYGAFVPNDQAVDDVVAELRKLSSDDAVEAMGEILTSDLKLPKQGKKKKKKKRTRKRKKKRKGDADPTWKMQILVVRAFEELDHAKTVEPVALQLERGTNPPVVNACVDVAHKIEEKRIVDGLIALLKRVEKQGGWEYHNVRQRLTDLTGKDFFTHEKWDGWWKGKRDGFDFQKKGETKEAKTRERGKKEKIPTFFGSEIKSNRLLFIIDVSGSMKMTDLPTDGEVKMSPEEFKKANPDTPDIKKYQRIERAKREVIGAINNMVATQRFNVIGFSDKNKYWRHPQKQGLAQATPANKAAAIKWCKALREGGGTYTDDALKAAFQNPEVDTIYFLSDGAPMRKVGNPGEQAKKFAEEEIKKCLYLVRELNRFRRVKIHTFGMDGPGVWHQKWGPRPETLPEEAKFLAPLKKFMQDLARLNGGDYKGI